MKDLALALRSLAKSPGTTGLVVVTLASAIAISTVIASTADMVWHFIPVERRDRLVFVASTDPRPDRSMSGSADGLARTGVSIPDLVDWTERTKTIEAFAAFTFENATLSGLDVPQRIAANRVTANLFDAWGVQTQLGRTFRLEEGRAGAPRVVLLSHAFWQQKLSGAADVLGTAITFDGQPHTIVGVLPASVNTGIFKTADVFAPLILDRERTARDERRLFTSAVLKPGISIEQANADLTAIAKQLQAEHPQTNAQTGAVVRPFIEMLGANITAVLFLLGLIALLVVFTACANVSSIILAQATTRGREFAVRAALGASRIQQMRRLLVESLAISALAGLLGLIFAWAGILTMRRVGIGTEGFADVQLNARVLAMGVLVALATPLGFALLPAWRLSKVRIEELRIGSRGTENPRARRLREALVVLQVAFVLVLVTQVGLIARTTWRLHGLEKGLDPEQVLTLRIELPEPEYRDSEQVRSFFARAIERIAALPGVVSAATVSTLPIADPLQSVRFVIDGRPVPSPEDRPEGVRADISPDYLRTMTIPVIRGRGLRMADFGNAPPVVLASLESVRRFWPNEDAIGRRIAFDGDTRVWLEVVGIVGDVRNPNAGSPPAAQFYVPSSLQPSRAAVFVVKSSGPDPTLLAPSIRRQLAALDPNVPLYDVNSMEREVFEDMGGTYLLTGMLAAIAVIALLLAAAGVYGLIAFTVSQRTREIGLRMALGALPSAVVRLMVARGSIPVTVGLVIGTAASVALISLTAAVMEEIDPRDPIAYALVWVPLLLTALAATYIPARRAARVDPLVVLRHE